MNRLLGEQTQVASSLMEEYSMTTEDAAFYAELMNKSYMFAMDKSGREEGGRSSWWCYGYCVECHWQTPEGDPVESWYIGRAQAPERKLAKAFVFLGGVTLVALTYGAAAWVGGLVMGAAAYFQVGAVLSIAGGTIGVGHLLTSFNNRACPDVRFNELRDANKDNYGTLPKMMARLWGKVSGTPTDEREYSLLDVFQIELLMRNEWPENMGVHYDRWGIPPKHRLAMVIACGMLSLHRDEWVDKQAVGMADKMAQVTTANRPDSPKALEDRERSIVYKCGQWLCNVASPHDKINFFQMGVLSTCGGRGHIRKGLGIR